MKVAVVIPALNPDELMLKTIEGLAKEGFSRFIIVDDGSDKEHQTPFEQAARRGDCVILRHAKNLGKGRALKTAFNYFLCQLNGDVGVVTVDADGQHAPQDVAACARRLEECPQNLVLGCRDFSLPDVPPKSRIGNRTICALFRIFAGITVADTQTGLRALSADVLRQVLDLPGEKFDYETTMLLQAKRKDIPFGQVKIQTIYIDSNHATHFHPVRDSLRILKLMLAFIAASLAGFGVDILAFTVIGLLFQGLPTVYRVLVATAGARVLSSLVNYWMNRQIVFQKYSQNSFFRYYLLCVLQAACSFFGVYALVALLGPELEVVFKIIVDVVLFFFSFQIQREWVFGGEKK